MRVNPLQLGATRPVQGYHLSTNRQNAEDSQQVSRNQDRVSISMLGRQKSGNKMESPLDSMLKQKQAIFDRKNSLINATLERGGDLDEIKYQLELFDEKMMSIENNITNYMLEQQQVALEKEKEKEASDEPITEEEAQRLEQAALVNLGTNIDQLNQQFSIKGRISQEKRILESELANPLVAPSKFTKARVSTIDQQIDTMNQAISNNLDSVETQQKEAISIKDHVEKPAQESPAETKLPAEEGTTLPSQETTVQ